MLQELDWPADQWKPTKQGRLSRGSRCTDDEVDFRFVPGPALSKKLIASVSAHSERGKHLEAFFGRM